LTGIAVSFGKGLNAARCSRPLNYRFVHASYDSQFVIRHLSKLRNDFFRQYFSIPSGNVMNHPTPLCVHVSIIIRARTFKQMIRVAAWRIVALMQNTNL